MAGHTSHVCPWWAAYAFDNVVRRLLHPADRILGPYVKEGMRAGRQGLAERIETVLAAPTRLGATGSFDFALASNVVHEVPDATALFAELFGLLRPGAILFVIEPAGGHVSEDRYAAELQAARAAGFGEVGSPPVRWQRAILLRKQS